MKALLTDAWRGIRSRRGPTLVASGGLMLAMTACLLVALLAIALSAPDPAIPDAERVVLLDFKGNPPGQPSPWFTASPVSFATMLKDRQVPLDLISRTSADGLDINHEGRLLPAYLLLADHDLIPLLGLEALHGDLRATLSQHDGVAITTGLVRKLWGELPLQQALGRRIESRGTHYTVTAVMPNVDPRSPIGDADPMLGDAMVIAGFDSQANRMDDASRNAIYMISGRVFARLPAGVSAEQVGGWMREAFVANPLYSQLPGEWKAGREAAYFRGITLAQLPFEGAHNEARWRLLAAVAGASLLLLILAAFNNMNLQAANLLQRQRETALRRSLGADSAQLLRLWSLETLLPLLSSAAGALLLAWWLAPAVANWMYLPPTYPVADPLPVRVVLGLAIAIAILLPMTLALPASLALRRPPAPALQGRTASEGPWGRRVRQALLTLQLGGALLLLILAGAMTMQQQHLLHADRGFDTRNRLWLGVSTNLEMVPNMDAFLAALDRHPAIKNWAFSDSRPASETLGRSELHVSAAHHKQVLRMTTVSPSFFDTYGMTVLAGEPRLASGEAHVVIDAKAARALGFPTPQAAIGELVRGGGGFLQEGSEERRIVAVVKDVKFESARDPALPQGFLLSDKPQWDLSIHGSDSSAVRAIVEVLWEQHGPPLVYAIETADEQRAFAYRQEQQMTTALTVLAIVAVGVAMLGAYTLVDDTLRRRRTELVLHRLHGAGSMDVAKQVAAEFAVPLLVAATITFPLAAWLGDRYLAGFVDRVGATAGLVWPIVLAGAVTLFCTTVAAARHVRLALALQPIEALR